jgi:vacuolar-type H+-ATPase subunit H
MLDVINEIKKTEGVADRIRLDALSEAKYIKSEAEEQGKRLLAEKKSEAETEAAGRIAAAEKQAEADLAAAKEKPKAEADLLSTEAEQKLDAAAKLIAERIVAK